MCKHTSDRSLVTIRSKRRLNGSHTLFASGVIVGEAWRRPSGKFGLRLDGVLWNSDDTPVAKGRGGLTTANAPRLKDAIALAEKVVAAGLLAHPN